MIEGSNNLRTWSYITKRNGKPVGVWQEKTTSVTYRYIRFRFENPHHDLYLGGLAEVQVWAPGTAPPLPSAGATATPTRTPTATTPPNGNYPMYGSSRSSNSTLPKAVWDGDLNTTWQTNGEDVPNSAYVYVTIGSVLPIGTIRWIYGTADIGDDLTIQVSNDKVTWTDVHTAGNAPVGEWQAVNLTDVSGKYIRWFFRNPNNDPVIGGLAEVEIYAPGAYKGDVEPSATPTGSATAEPSAEASPASPEPILTETPVPVETATETATETPKEVATGTPADLDQLAPPETSPVGERPSETATPEPTGPTPYPVIQTSRSASTVSGTFAVDNDPSTVWGTDANAHPGRTAHLTLDFGQPVDVAQVRIQPGPDGLRGTATIETSNDGKSWNYYADVDPTQPDENGRLTINPGKDVPVPVAARYVRIVFVSPTEGQPLGGISEIEVLPPE